MPEEHKKMTFEFAGSKLKVTVDPNQDGEPVISLVINLAEIPDEIVDAIKNRGK